RTAHPTPHATPHARPGDRDPAAPGLDWVGVSTAKPRIPNVLATRYASPQLARLWSADHNGVLERRLWLAVLKAQAALGVHVDPAAVADYEKVVEQVDLDSIAARERVTRHDVKARIEEFNDLAGHQDVHKGMTSRDLTENVEQLQIPDSLLLVRRSGERRGGTGRGRGWGKTVS